MKGQRKTRSEEIAKKNAKATRRMRQGVKRTAELQERVRKGEMTAGQALRERLGWKGFK